MTTRISSDTAPAALPPPSGRSLLKATLVALVIAAIVLVVAVLPAEYGIDPLGAGRALGLDKLFAASEEAQANEANPSGLVTAQETPLHRQLNQYRVDTREFKIPPMTGMEFKYDLNKGATMLYEWKSSFFVDFDFHTEPEGAPPGTSDSFEKGTSAQSRGGYTAPYDGIHGWYWENKTDREITLTLNASGFFQSARIFLPDVPPQNVQIPERQ
jgi:hypothetical protein